MDINDTLQAAERTAARLLCEHPEIDLDDRRLVIERCRTFKVDLSGPQKTPYAYEDVRRRANFLRSCAEMAAPSWRVDELHRSADKLYDPRKDPEEQSIDFYLAQAKYQLVRVHNGRAQLQPQNLVA